jgi:DNA-binding MarR family transcriptional regulator
MERVQVLSRNLRQINNLYTKILSKELSPLHLDHHFEVLLMLAVQEQPITQNKLAALMQIDKSRMANIIYDLEQKDLVYVQRNPEDRRQHYVYLSTNAKTSIPFIEQVVNKINEFAKAGITQEKLLAFFEVSEQIQQNLKNISSLN